IEVRPSRIVVGVERDERRELRPGARMGARRVLAQPGPVQAEPQQARADGPAVLPEQMPPLDLRPVVAEPLAAGIEAERRRDPRPSGERRMPGDRSAAVAPCGRPEGRLSLSRRAVDHVDDAHERGGAVHDGSGAAQDLDPIHVRQVERGERRIEGAARRDAVHGKEEGVELLQTPEFWHVAGGAAVAARGDVDARDERQGAPEVVRPPPQKLLPTDDRHRDGGRRRLFRDARGGDLDALLEGGRLRSLCRLLREDIQGVEGGQRQAERKEEPQAMERKVFLDAWRGRHQDPSDTGYRLADERLRRSRAQCGKGADRPIIVDLAALRKGGSPRPPPSAVRWRLKNAESYHLLSSRSLGEFSECGRWPQPPAGSPALRVECATGDLKNS